MANLLKTHLSFEKCNNHSLKLLDWAVARVWSDSKLWKHLPRIKLKWLAVFWAMDSLRLPKKESIRSWNNGIWTVILCPSQYIWDYSVRRDTHVLHSQKRTVSGMVPNRKECGNHSLLASKRLYVVFDEKILKLFGFCAVVSKEDLLFFVYFSEFYRFFLMICVLENHFFFRFFGEFLLIFKWF